MKHICLLFLTCYITCGAYAQYAPQAGVAGSTAIPGTSAEFVGWATGCTVKRGYLDIAQPSLGYASAGDSSMAIGPADVFVVSLGDSGVADLTFAAPIVNGPGPDLAVFENGFTDPADPTMAFLELGFVEVSSDGVNYFRFPATSNTQDTLQVSNGKYTDARLLNNLAGKYIARYGTPFDLEEMAGIQGLDIDHITHVRVIDVVGDIGRNACRDSSGRPVNDPYPTPFATGGFDLDAVGVIHQAGVGVNNVAGLVGIQVYPNPVTEVLNITLQDTSTSFSAVLADVTGRIVAQLQVLQNKDRLVVRDLRPGVYYLVIQDINGRKWVEKIVKF